MKIQVYSHQKQQSPGPKSPSTPNTPLKQVQWKKYFLQDFRFEEKLLLTKPNEERPVLVLDLNKVTLTYESFLPVAKQGLEKIFATQAWNQYLVGAISKVKAYKKIESQTSIPVNQVVHLLNCTRDALKPIRRCIDFINIAKNLGALLVAFTNCPQEQIFSLIKKFDFFSQFDFILNSGYIGFKKPNKQSYLALCNYLNVSPQQVVYLDDKKQNIEMGRQIGFHSFECKGEDAYEHAESCLKSLTLKNLQKINISVYSSNLSRGYTYLTSLADLDKYGFYQSMCGIGKQIITNPKKSNQIFCAATILNLSNTVALSPLGSRMIMTLQKMHENHKYKFFSDLDVITQDLDTTSIVLSLLYKYDLVSDEIVSNILEEMKDYVDDYVYLTFFTHKRYRKCPIVGTNVLFLIYLTGRQSMYQTNIEKTKAFIMSQLMDKKYEKGVTFYPNPDLYLFQIAKLVYNFPNDFQEFHGPLISALKQRLLVPAENTLSLAIRCILCMLNNVDCTNDFQKLIDQQLKDGSWEQSYVFWTSSATPDKKCYWSSRAYNTGFCCKALQMKIFGKDIFKSVK